MGIVKWTAIIFLCLLVIGVCLMFYRALRSQDAAPELGVVSGQLQQCPDSPNCVSSYATDGDHHIAPFDGDAEEFDALVAFISESGEANIEVHSEAYLWATYKSSFFGFVDDLELYFDGSQIHVRSASREGYSDLGVNRKRVETLRSYLQTRR